MGPVFKGSGYSYRYGLSHLTSVFDEIIAIFLDFEWLGVQILNGIKIWNIPQPTYFWPFENLTCLVFESPCDFSGVINSQIEEIKLQRHL